MLFNFSNLIKTFSKSIVMNAHESSRNLGLEVAMHNETSVVTYAREVKASTAISPLLVELLPLKEGVNIAF